MSSIDSEVILLVAMICITVLGGLAMYKGLNGNTFLTVIAAIVTISGYLYAQKVKKGDG